MLNSIFIRKTQKTTLHSKYENVTKTKTARGTRPAISCPAGRTQFMFWPAGRPAGRLPGCFCIGFVFGRPAGRLLGWLAGWLCLLDVFVHILQYSTQLYSTNTVQYSTAILFSLQYSRVLLILHWCVFVVHWVSCVFSIVFYWCY